MIDINPYLRYLCDPVSRYPLRVDRDEHGAISLVCDHSKRRYPFVGEFPDLRPDAGASLDQATTASIFSKRLGEKQDEVRGHYDQKPCNNYLDLDNVPLGRWLRQSDYNAWFDGVEFAVEVGSGKGAIASAILQHRGIREFCVDLAYGSLRQIRAAPLNLDGVLGSNLRLPLKNEVADLVVSHGVIHHTPDPVMCFCELVRILKPKGRLLIAVYNWDNLYRSLYFFMSPPLKAVRRILGPRMGDLLLKGTVFLPYHLALWLVLIKTQRRFGLPSWQESWEQFCDFFLTPFARFYMKEEMISLAQVFGLTLLEHASGGWPNNGFAHFYWFQKSTALDKG